MYTKSDYGGCMVKLGNMKRRIIFVVVMLLTFALIGAAVMAATPTTLSTTSVPTGAYYVAATGSDTNAGSATAPFRTIQRAINTVPAGSTIVVKAGTYNEKLSISSKSGLTIVNNPGDKPVLTGAGFSSGYLISIAGSNNIVFSGFEVSNFKGPELEGIVIHNASKNIEISNCLIHDIATTLSGGNVHAILAVGDSNTAMTNITIKNNEVYNCTTGWSESITVGSNVDGFTISNNKIHDVTNIGIDAAGFYSNGCTIASMNQARNGLIANNLVYNLASSYASCAGIYVDGGRDIIVENNTVHNSQYGIEVGCENPYDKVNTSVRAIVSGIIVRNNTIYNNTEVGIGIGGYNSTSTGKVINSQVYNNTFYKNQAELVLQYCDNISFSRNIFYGNSQLIYNDPINKVTNLKMSSNVYYTESGSGAFEVSNKSAYSLSAWQSISGQDLTSKFADPLFVNKSSYNFSLQTSSPAAGIIGSTNANQSTTTTQPTASTPTPASFAVKTASYSSVRLSWNAVTGATGYMVYRSTSAAGTYSLVKTIASGNTTSYINGGLTTGKAYYYKVRAYKMIGTTKNYSNFTAIKSAKPVPNVPANFTVVRYSSTSIKTSWNVVSGASGYQIYRATSSTGTYTLVKSTTSTSWINGSLTNGKLYYYKIRAYRMVGTTKVLGSYNTIKFAKPY